MNESKTHTKDNLMKPILFFLITAIISGFVGGLFAHQYDLRTIGIEPETYSESDTVDELLLKAQNCYKSGNYAEAVEIYDMEKLRMNPLAVSNLAYFYANGIYLSQDIEKAKELYRNAYLIDESYIDGYLRIVLKHPSDWSEVIDVLNQGLRLECDNAYLLLSSTDDLNTDMNSLVEDYMSMDNKSKRSFIEAKAETHYEWDREHLDENEFVRYIEDADYKRKEHIGTYDSNGESKPLYGTVTYRLYAITEFKSISRIADSSYIEIVNR